MVRQTIRLFRGLRKIWRISTWTCLWLQERRPVACGNFLKISSPGCWIERNKWNSWVPQTGAHMFYVEELPPLRQSKVLMILSFIWETDMWRYVEIGHGIECYLLLVQPLAMFIFVFRDGSNWDRKVFEISDLPPKCSIDVAGTCRKASRKHMQKTITPTIKFA